MNKPIFALVIILFTILFSCTDKVEVQKTALSEYFKTNNWKYKIDDVRIIVSEEMTNNAMCDYIYNNYLDRMQGLLNSAKDGFPSDELYNKLDVEKELYSKCDFPNEKYAFVKYSFIQDMDKGYQYFFILNTENKVLYHGNIYSKD